MRKLIMLSIFLSFLNCKNDFNKTKPEYYNPGNTAIETLKTMIVSHAESPMQFHLEVNYYKENLDEILNSIEIVESVDFRNKYEEELKVVFYKFFVGAKMIRKVEYFQVRNDKYFIKSEYISKYSDDSKEKELAEKIDNWRTINKF
ncbi:hypothetical protein [Mangrovimonas sp. ST2L15]|uniref:hypothetical protein n=1 Tax=Mangrovimonas sp. ST2L15 TaxID=1645916 RepID=UPI0006B490FA|nr:hypothetical protein [Mangrovimonas sp. ST2L15]